MVTKTDKDGKENTAGAELLASKDVVDNSRSEERPPPFERGG